MTSTSGDVSEKNDSTLNTSKIDTNSEIDLLALFDELWACRKLIVSATVFVAFIALIIALILPNIYKAEAILAPVNEEANGLSSMLGNQLGGLASLAGVNLPTSGQSFKAIATLQSRKFLVNFIRRRKLEFALIAQRWNPFSHEHSINSSIFNEQTNKWTGEMASGNIDGPSDWQLYNTFSNLLKVRQDPKTNLVSISIEWYNPKEAALWTNWLVKDLNYLLRNQERQKAERSIEYLKQQLESTKLLDIQQALFQLIESQLKVVMLADATNEYAFKVIDPANIPESKFKPKRKLIVILGGIFGCIISIFIIIVLYFISLNTKRSYG